MDRNSMLWEMYKEQCAFIRHHETQRSTVVNFIILIGGGLVTVISGNGFSKSDLALAILLIFVGLFGAIFSASNFERYYRSKRQARAYRNELDDNLSNAFPEGKRISDIKATADLETAKSHPLLHKFSDDNDFKTFKPLFSVHALWIILPMLLALIGAIIFVLCFFDVNVGVPNK